MKITFLYKGRKNPKKVRKHLKAGEMDELRSAAEESMKNPWSQGFVYIDQCRDIKIDFSK